MNSAHRKVVRLGVVALVLCGLFPPWVAVVRNIQSGVEVRRQWVGYSLIMTTPDLQDVAASRSSPAILQNLVGRGFGEEEQDTEEARVIAAAARMGLDPNSLGLSKGTVTASKTWRGFSTSSWTVEIDAKRLLFQSLVIMAAVMGSFLFAGSMTNRMPIESPAAFVTVLGVRFPLRLEKEEIRSTLPRGESDRAIADPQAATPTGRNGFAIAGLSLGVAGILLNEIGLIPILAIVFSGIGLGNVRKLGGRGRTQAWVGLVLGILYTLVYLRTYGRI